MDKVEQRHKAAAGDAAVPDADDVKIHSIMGQIVSALRQKIHVNAIRNVFLCMGTGEAHPFTFPPPPLIVSRLQHNLHFFLVNYILLFVLVLFCVLVFHPWSLLCCVATTGAWIAFTFQRKHFQQVYKNSGIKEDHVVYAMLGATALVFAFFLLPSLLSAGSICGVLAGAHALLRSTDQTKLVRSAAVDPNMPVDQQV
ncbi:hypothetical protein AC1031_006006 [Aphanomyces cochlioides]|nr:hypothetical protein AC1031_006006 [Aphanomyces cochlioides]